METDRSIRRIIFNNSLYRSIGVRTSRCGDALLDAHFPDLRDECISYVLKHVQESRQYSKGIISARPDLIAAGNEEDELVSNRDREERKKCNKETAEMSSTDSAAVALSALLNIHESIQPDPNTQMSTLTKAAMKRQLSIKIAQKMKSTGCSAEEAARALNISADMSSVDAKARSMTEIAGAGKASECIEEIKTMCISIGDRTSQKILDIIRRYEDRRSRASDGNMRSESLEEQISGMVIVDNYAKP